MNFNTSNQYLTEALGVDPTLHDSAEQLMDDIIDDIYNAQINFEDTENYIEATMDLKFPSTAQYDLGPYKLIGPRIVIIVKLHDYSHIPEGELPYFEMESMGIPLERGVNSVYEKAPSLTSARISFTFIGDKDVVTNNIAYEVNKYLNENKSKCVSSLAHELSHLLFFTNKSKVSPPKNLGMFKSHRAKSRALMIHQNLHTNTLNQFVFLIYFTSSIESIVHSQEFWSQLIIDNVKKHNFVEFLTSSRIYSEYLKGSKLTYESLIQSLMEGKDFESVVQFILEISDNEEIKQTAVSALEDNDYSKKLAVVNEYLSKIHIGITNIKTEQMFRMLHDLSDMLAFFISTSNKVKEEIVNDINRYYYRGGFYENFYKYNIKNINIKSKYMLKKLGKLYALLGE